MRTFKTIFVRISVAVIVGLLAASATGCATLAGDGPRLDKPVGDDLFRDGVAEVTLANPIDGDTAVFIVNGESYSTRFLAVNTPEVSHPTYGEEPWGRAAKAFTAEILTNAKSIVLELDPESDTFDSYDRLLAWVWVDGELLNYRLVKEGFAWVMFLYGDYRYNGLLIQTESETRKEKIRIHGETDPDYDYEKRLVDHTLESVRSERIGKRVHVSGIVTAKIGNNAYMQEGDHGLYIYTSNKRWKYLIVGNRVDTIGMLSDYNGLLELGNIESINLIEEAVALPEPVGISLSEIGEEYEARLVTVEALTIEGVQPHTGRGYNVTVSQGDAKGVIRVDKYLIPYIEPEFFKPGDSYTITAVVGQYVNTYQLMLSTLEHLTPVE